MREDLQLVWKFKQGSEEALRRIYEKYNKDMVGLAIALSNNKSIAEDAVGDTGRVSSNHAFSACFFIPLEGNG